MLNQKIVDTKLMEQAIVEQGTSGIWSYRKWADGTLECWGVYSGSIAVNTSSAAYGGYRSGSVSVDSYPIAFISKPVVVGAGREGMNGSWLNVLYTSTTNPGFYLSCGASQAAATREISIYAVGKWK